MASADLKFISREEVSTHKNENDYWIIIHDKVYDVTKFLKEHPGGEEVLIESAGKDATVDFDDVGHSISAKEQLTEFLIGVTSPLESKKPAESSNCKAKSRCLIMAGSALLVGLGAFLIYKGCRQRL